MQLAQRVIDRNWLTAVAAPATNTRLTLPASFSLRGNGKSEGGGKLENGVENGIWFEGTAPREIYEIYATHQSQSW